jgi:hypothetical protein
MAPADSASSAGSVIPESLWKADTLYLPAALSASHKAQCEAKGWMSEYAPATAPPGVIGGSTAEEAKAHFINRFLNSAARSQYACADPRNEYPEVRDMVLDQLGEGHIFILDLAAGHGAGTMAILSLIAELRGSGCTPKLPVNVSITGVDFSADALNLYHETLERLIPTLRSQGIEVHLESELCNLAITAEFSETLDTFFDAAKSAGVSRFLCVLSAISGVGKEGVSEINDSLKIAAARLGHSKRSSSWLWLEPTSNKTWFQAFRQSVAAVMQRVRHTFAAKGESYETKGSVPHVSEVVRKFVWIDPHTTGKVTSHVVVVAFKNK